MWLCGPADDEQGIQATVWAVAEPVQENITAVAVVVFLLLSVPQTNDKTIVKSCSNKLSHPTDNTAFVVLHYLCSRYAKDNADTADVSYDNDSAGTEASYGS